MACWSLDTQILVGVSGRAGFHPYYNRDYLIKVSFIVFDTNTQTTTVYGVSSMNIL